MYEDLIYEDEWCENEWCADQWYADQWYADHWYQGYNQIYQSQRSQLPGRDRWLQNIIFIIFGRTLLSSAAFENTS